MEDDALRGLLCPTRCLRMYAERWQFFHQSWNIFDLTIISASYVDVIMRCVMQTEGTYVARTRRNHHDREANGTCSAILCVINFYFVSDVLVPWMLQACSYFRVMV